MEEEGVGAVSALGLEIRDMDLVAGGTEGMTVMEVVGVEMTLGSRVVGITRGKEVVVEEMGVGIKEVEVDGILEEVEVGT